MTARPGFALVVALLVVAALSMAAAGMLALGARESEIASAMARRSAARLAAESAAGWALAGWSTRRYRELAAGEESDAVDAPVPSGSDGSRAVAGSFTVARLGPALYLVHGTGHYPDGGNPDCGDPDSGNPDSGNPDGGNPDGGDPDGGQPSGRQPAAGRAGVLVRTVDPEALADGFPAAVSAGAGARVEAGVVDGGGAVGVLAPYATIAAGAVVTGAPPVVLEPPPALPMPELFAAPLLDALATITVTVDAITPRPVVGPGGCEPGPSNWGAVSPASMCHDHLPLVRAVGDLVVRGGEGRGLLVVDGDLGLEGVRFNGAILVRGKLTIGDGTVVRGAVRATTVEVGDGSIARDADDLVVALTAGGLDGPFRPAHRLWIPVF